MQAADIPRLRLAAQGLTGSRPHDPADVVRALGAMQAQDYGQSLWAVGSRLGTGTLRDVEQAIADARIVRSWPMRGTIHLMAADDVRWLVGLCAPRVAAGDARRLQQLGLTDRDVGRAAELVGAAFEQTPGPITRARLMETFEAAGLGTAGQRGYHLLWRLAQDRLICLGPLAGKEQTFALLDQWIPPAAELDRDDALARIAHRFAASRGPVTAHDLARWSGLTVTDARRGLRSDWAPPDGAALETAELAGTEYWLPAGAATAKPDRGWRRPLLLAGFDEFLIGYKGRDDILDPAHFEKIVPGGNGVFKPMLVQDGRIVGIWKRELTAKRLRVSVGGFEVGRFEAGSAGLASLAGPIRAYHAFLDLPPAVQLEPPTLLP